ncbi:MAG: hypothetical protein PHV74_14920 [Dehalococcoidia bacterium]|nr:hypothetical protein [Dehalococcoidia bacterium]
MNCRLAKMRVPGVVNRSVVTVADMTLILFSLKVLAPAIVVSVANWEGLQEGCRTSQTAGLMT